MSFGVTNMKKRILALVLLLVLILQFVPAYASAAKADVTLTVPKEYSIDGKTSYSLTKQEYKDLLLKVHDYIQDELDALSLGMYNLGTIKVNDDCTEVTVVVWNVNLSAAEKEAEGTYFDYCKMYAAYAQKKLDKITVIYKNGIDETLWTTDVSAAAATKSAAAKNNTAGNKNTTKNSAAQASQDATRSGTSSGTMVWIPNSGKKYHSKSSCSNMKNPTQVTESEAIRRGYGKCSKCW